MANPPKAKDPAEAALSAVEEALKIDFGDLDENDKASGSGSETASAGPASSERSDRERTGELAATSTTSDSQRASSKRGRGGGRPTSAANDDRRTIGNLIYALQRRPSSAPFWFALALSVVWVAVGWWLASAIFSTELSSVQSAGDIASSPSLILLSVAVVVPVLFFWAMALMIFRAQEMRIVARGMT